MEQNKDKTIVQATAKLRNCSMSARKMRLVADIVRGASAEKAVGILKFTRKEAAQWIGKLLGSAIANWGNVTGEAPEEYGLVVKAIFVDQGAQLKRFRPAPHGRAHRIRKHFCHVTIVVENTIAVEGKTQAAVEPVAETAE